MSPPRVKREPPALSTRSGVAAIILALACAMAWHGSFTGPFVLDDHFNIVGNDTIRDLTALGRVLDPPSSSGVGGRPFLNFTFTLNHALGGLSVESYHVFNLLVHVGSALTLFALVRATLLTERLRGRFAANATLLALGSAALWALHPLQTQSVTYISQRAESLMALLYLLTLYSWVRGATTTSPSRWLTASVFFCTLGMATKEVMVTAPIVVLLFDRTFLAGSFAAAWRVRRRFYLGLALTWMLLVVLMADVSARGVGLAHGVTWWSYALTEIRAVLVYLRLVFFPFALVFDYAPHFAGSLAEVAREAIVLALIVAAAAIVYWRKPAAGFLAAWFFLILAPSSSIVPVAFSPIAESRPYLPLAAVAVAATVGLHTLLGRRSIAIVFLVSIAFAALVARRNRDYRTEEFLWRDTVVKQPRNERAHYVLGLTLAKQGKFAEAVPHFQATLRLDPRYPDAENNLANSLAMLGRQAEAIPHYERALHLHPTATKFRSNLALALLALERPREAEDHARLAVRQNPHDPASHHALGSVLRQRGELAGAITTYRQALQAKPDASGIRLSLAEALSDAGLFAEAKTELDLILAGDARRIDAHAALGEILIAQGEGREALRRAQELAKRFPRAPEVHVILGRAYRATGQLPQAASAYQQALQLRPGFPPALTGLNQLAP